MTSLDRRVYTVCALLALPLAAMHAARLARRLADKAAAAVGRRIDAVDWSLD